MEPLQPIISDPDPALEVQPIEVQSIVELPPDPSFETEETHPHRQKSPGKHVSHSNWVEGRYFHMARLLEYMDNDLSSHMLPEDKKMRVYWEIVEVE